PEIPATLDPRRPRIIAQESPDSGGAASEDVALLVADHPGACEIEIEVDGRLQDHARTGLAPPVLAAIGANTFGRMVGAVISSGDGDAMVAELGGDEVAQGQVFGLAIEAAADACLVGGNDDGEAAIGKRFRRGEDTVDEA